MKILFFPYTWLAPSKTRIWLEYLRNYIEGKGVIDVFPYPDPSYTFNENVNAPLDQAFDLLNKCEKDYDWIVGEGYGAMFWTVLTRILNWDVPALIGPHLNPTTKSHLLINLLFKTCQHPLDCIAIGSKASRDLLKEQGVNTIAHQLFGINSDNFQKLKIPRSQLLKELGLPEGIYLLYSGRIQEDKSVGSLMSIFARIGVLCPESRLLLVSHVISEEYMEEFSHLIAGNKHVKVISDVTQTELNKYYNLADLFVSTSTNETFGLAPVEAMICGTPCVVPAYGGFRDTVTPEVGTLVSATWEENGIRVNALEFVRRVYELISDPHKRYLMSKAAQRHAQQYCWRNTMNLLDSLLYQDKPKPTAQHMIISTVNLPKYLQEVIGEWHGKSVPDLLGEFFKIDDFTQEELKLYYRNAFRNFI